MSVSLCKLMLGVVLAALPGTERVNCENIVQCESVVQMKRSYRRHFRLRVAPTENCGKDLAREFEETPFLDVVKTVSLDAANKRDETAQSVEVAVK
jgi:hypothetical protein